MQNIIFPTAVLILPLLIGVFFLRRNARRSALDVFDDLRCGTEIDVVADDHGNAISTDRLSDKFNARERAKLSDELSKVGLIEKNERRKFLFTQHLMFFGTIFFVVLIGVILGKNTPAQLIPFLVLSIAVGYLAHRVRLKKLQNAHKQSLEFYLPLVMERLVMAAEAGLDIIPALSVIVKVEEQNLSVYRQQLDPVTRLIKLVTKLTDAGLSFEDALSISAKGSESHAVQHAFIHLGLAQREGGELVMPLRELSDSTQLYFQETVEETIAKMPAKATMPLLCTFSGLVICFLTPAMLQVMLVLEKSMPK